MANCFFFLNIGLQHKWKDSELPTKEEWLMEMTELMEMAKLTCLITQRSTSAFISEWKPFMKFAGKREMNLLFRDLQIIKRSLWEEGNND